MSCVVPGCRSNYRKEDAYTSTFSFPTDNDTREMWFRAIPRRREDYEMNKYLKVAYHYRVREMNVICFEFRANSIVPNRAVAASQVGQVST